VRARGIGGARTLAAPDQGIARYGALAGGAPEGADRATRGLEPVARGAGSGAVGGNRANWPLAAVLGPASGADDRRLGRVGVAIGEPPTRGDGDVLRLAWLHRVYRGVRARRGHRGPARIPRELG